MSDETHPFVPGTEVIVQSNYSHYGKGTFTLDKVLKLHKTGRFTLASDPAQQWHASKYSDDAEWFGRKTRPSGRYGYSIYNTRLRLANEEAKKELAEALAQKVHESRCAKIKAAMEKPNELPHEVSKALVSLIEANTAPSDNDSHVAGGIGIK